MSEEWFIPRQEARDIDLSSSKADYSDEGGYNLDNDSNSSSSSFHSSLCSINIQWVFTMFVYLLVWLVLSVLSCLKSSHHLSVSQIE